MNRAREGGNPPPDSGPGENARAKPATGQSRASTLIRRRYGGTDGRRRVPPNGRPQLALMARSGMNKGAAGTREEARLRQRLRPLVPTPPHRSQRARHCHKPAVEYLKARATRRSGTLIRATCNDPEGMGDDQTPALHVQDRDLQDSSILHTRRVTGGTRENMNTTAETSTKKVLSK